MLADQVHPPWSVDDPDRGRVGAPEGLESGEASGEFGGSGRGPTSRVTRNLTGDIGRVGHAGKRSVA
jgi:hypothetical protein